MKIVVTDYKPEWAKQFEELSQGLLEVLSGYAVTIEHVGSTSVKGLSAKPVIDIDIIVTRKNVSSVVLALETNGYMHRGDLGIQDREAFSNPSDSHIDHHLYVCVEGSLALRNHLFLRDKLRSSAEDVIAYGQLKKGLAAKYSDDIDSYIAGKTKFILNILKSLDFSESELLSIREPNMNSKSK